MTVGWTGEGRSWHTAFMKWATGIILALLVGIAVGGWSPRARVRRLKTALADAQSGQEGGRSRGGSVSPTITGLLQIPEAKTDRTPDRVGEESNAVPTGVAAPSNQTDTAVAAASPAAVSDAADAVDEEGRQDLAARIEAAAEVWRLRSEVARDQFLARVDANAQESTRLNTG